jgi:hypothetical protein
MAAALATRSFSLRGPVHASGKAALRRSLACAGVVMAALAGSPVGKAAPRDGDARAAPPPTHHPSPPPGCPRDERSALTELACELSRELGASAGGSVAVGAAPPTSDRPLKSEQELAQRLIRRVAEALGPNTEALAPQLSFAEARRAGKRAQTLVYLSLSIASGEARVTALSEPTSVGFWGRVRGKSEGSRRQAFASRRVDAEIAAFLPPIPLSAANVEKAALKTSDVVAIGCGDADGDSGLEIALLGRRKIQLGRVRAHAFVAHAETTWSALGTVAPAPLREPLAAVDFLPRRGILVGSTDRRSGAWLTPELKKQKDLSPGVLPIPGLGCTLHVGVSLSGLYDCFTAKARTGGGAVSNADAVAGAIVVDAQGKGRSITAVRGAADGILGLADDRQREARVARIGGAIAIADVDLDGTPELVASTDAKAAAADALVVSSFGEDGTVQERYRVPVPEGIRALSVCPPDGAGPRAIVVATPSNLYLVR